MSAVEQLGLSLEMGASPTTFVDDASGRIAYFPASVPTGEAQRWFDAIRDETDWRRERRPMYDRVVDVPRLVASFREGDALPRTIAAAKSAVEASLGMRFNSVGLNRYRDGRDSVAMHNDHTEELEPLSPIALLSLGSTRTMRLQTKAKPRRIINVALAPGSILLMAGAAQDNWEHGIPKTREPVGERISLAFRLRPRA